MKRESYQPEKEKKSQANVPKAKPKLDYFGATQARERGRETRTMTRQWSRLDRRNAGASRHGCNPRHDRAADEEGTCPPHATLVYADKDERAPAALGAPVALSPLQSPLLLLLGSPLVPRQAGAMPPRRLTALFRAVFSAHATRFFHMVHARSFFHVWRFSSSPLSFQLSPPFSGWLRADRELLGSVQRAHSDIESRQRRR